jgi:AAA+ superfamily predicted ATPase
MAKIETILSAKIDNVPLSEIDTQEHLDIKRLMSLKETKSVSGLNECGYHIDRPTNSLIKMMGWAEHYFGQSLNSGNGKPLKINRFIHNKIVIDGEFLRFCEEEKIKIEVLMRDAIASWKTSEGNEGFYMQGVFLITKGKTRFIHCALFHKGNQNEDEVSTFVLVDDESYEGYIQIRNQFDDWSVKRDRNHLLIHVVDGDDIPYERDMSWEDLFLPEELKTNIKTSVEGFLKSKKIYQDRGIAWRRGMILYGSAGNGKSSLIKTIISNYDFKPVMMTPGGQEDSLVDAFMYAESQSPALLFFEDLDSMLQEINISLFLNLMDGVSSKNGLLVIATANELDKLKANIKDRPSRFDRKFEIPAPNFEMAFKYIKKWFGTSIPEKNAKGLAEYAVKYGFSYAYLKELYISAVYIAIGDNRDKPNAVDVDAALKQILEEKYRKTGKNHIGLDKYTGTGT